MPVSDPRPPDTARSRSTSAEAASSPRGAPAANSSDATAGVLPDHGGQTALSPAQEPSGSTANTSGHTNHSAASAPISTASSRANHQIELTPHLRLPPQALTIATSVPPSATAAPASTVSLRPSPANISSTTRQQLYPPSPASAASDVSRTRSPSSLSLSSIVREPFSAYSRAYAIPHHSSISSLRQGRDTPSVRSGRTSIQSVRDEPRAESDFELRQRDQAAAGRRPTTVTELTEFSLFDSEERGIQSPVYRSARPELSNMPLGIIDTRDGKAPGTVTVMSDEQKTSGTAIQGSMSPENTLNPKLKYDRSGSRPILLVPQPTDDPNDPLNWPRWKRDSILVILSMMSVIASTLSPLLAANTWSLTVDFFFEYTFTDMALLTGYHLLAVGLSGFLFVASARVWGKRHLYLLGCLLIIASSAWGGATGLNYNSLLGARIVQGIGLAPFEALVNASVGDLFFVHERGSRMALSNMALFGGAFFTPIIVGKMTSTIGWQWTFYFVAIFSGVMFPFIFFFVPETTYVRPEGTITEVDSLGNPLIPEYDGVAPAAGSFSGPMAGTANDPVQTSVANEKGSTESSTEEGRNGSALSPRREKIPFAKTLLPFNGRHSNENILKLALRPFPLFLQPAILWACLIQGALIGWTVLMGVVLAALFIQPPLGFTEVQTGYMYAGPFIGAFVGFILCGILADWSAKALIRANRGVYEPEFRLPLVILQLLLGCSGLYGFGWTAQQVRYAGKSGWFWPDFCFALEVAGMVVGAVASALYIVDAHRDIQVEAFTCLLIFKNIFSFALTYKAFDWVRKGPWVVFRAIGSVQVGICALTIPMCE